MGLRYFINNLTGQLEDGRGERILPKPKPERPVADQYQDYKQVQDIFEPRTQMYIEKELGFDDGGRVSFKEGEYVKDKAFLKWAEEKYPDYRAQGKHLKPYTEWERKLIKKHIEFICSTRCGIAPHIWS